MPTEVFDSALGTLSTAKSKLQKEILTVAKDFSREVVNRTTDVLTQSKGIANNIKQLKLRDVLEQFILIIPNTVRGVHEYVNAETDTIVLNQNDFKLFTYNYEKVGEITEVTFEDGSTGFKQVVSQGAAGVGYLNHFTLYTDKNGNPVGLFDILDYDFKIDDAIINGNFSNYNVARDVAVVFAQGLIALECLRSLKLGGQPRPIIYGKQEKK